MKHTGDIRILKKCYDMMKKWVEYQNSTDRRNYGVRTVDGKEVPEQSDLATIPYIQVQQCRGDHLTYDNSTPYIYPQRHMPHILPTYSAEPRTFSAKPMMKNDILNYLKI